MLVVKLYILNPARYCSLTNPQTPRVQLLNHLREKEALLVLDGYEHLLPEASLLGEILQQAPAVKLLVTSRERLHLRWEWCFAVEGLTTPPLAEEGLGERFEKYDAMRLFQQMARRVSRRAGPLPHDESAVAHVCRLVEGMPLAIELAAAWVGTRTVSEIADEIEHNVGFLSTSLRDVPARAPKRQHVGSEQPRRP